MHSNFLSLFLKELCFAESPVQTNKCVSVYVHVCRRDRPQVPRKTSIALARRKDLGVVITWSPVLVHPKDYLIVNNIVIPSGYPLYPYMDRAFQSPPRLRKF